ncbi:ATP synthase subunit I [Euhalothece natronophila Z-M001]|uniref:ATP synthase subunit I n=1 Tax=Euhalothece natronophila Z-M001 TaxID=522448 RepID=A0A5B8NN39_9CHRO|nr:ATP synthase subunit I [Euhalothece natronophila]QDZ40316.1 ATP synthase subunit I [Euhalothece natronophila Z-M001]
MSAPETTDSPTSEASEETNSDRAMTEFYQLQRNLYLVMLGLTVVIFVSVWVAYSGNTALNYLLGACAGLLYFRRLARDIEGLGVSKQGVGFGSVRLAIFIAVMVVAAQLERLAILPVFLGFMTYKAAIIVYVVQTTLFPKGK